MCLMCVVRVSNFETLTHDLGDVKLQKIKSESKNQRTKDQSHKNIRFI